MPALELTSETCCRYGTVLVTVYLRPRCDVYNFSRETWDVFSKIAHSDSEYSNSLHNDSAQNVFKVSLVLYHSKEQAEKTRSGPLAI